MKHSSIFFFIVIALLIYCCINFYLLRRTSQALDGTGMLRNMVLWGISVAALSFPLGRIGELFFVSSITDAVVWVGSLYLGIMFYGVLVAVSVDLVRLVNHFFPFTPSSPSLAKIVWCVGAGVIAMVVVAGYCIGANPRLQTADVHIAKRVAGLSSLNVVVVTDMHLGTVVGISQLRRILTLIQEVKPDIVLLGGDVFDMDVSDKMEREIATNLGAISSQFGVFAVTGNHEYFGGVEKAVANLTKGNVTVLQDTSVLLEGAFYVIGRKDLTAERMGGGRKTLDEICNGLDRSKPLILMDHQPFHLEAAQRCGIDLQVSGHTHNAQLFPLNLFYGLIYEKSWGYLKKGQTHFYVSCGAGTWGPPIKTSCIAEVVHIRIHFDG